MFAFRPEETRERLHGELLSLNLETVQKAALIFLDLYALDTLQAGAPKAEGEPEQVIRVADSGPAVMRGVYRTCERLIYDRNNPKKEGS